MSSPRAMSKSLQLLKQVRRCAAAIACNVDHAESKALLMATDCVLNELLLLNSTDFYLRHLETGKTLLAEGLKLLADFGERIATPKALRDDLTAESSIDVVHADIDTLLGNLLTVVAALDEGRSALEKKYVIRVCDWEAGMYQHSLEQGDAAGNAQDGTITRDALQTYLRERSPDAKGLRVTRFAPLQGGFSKKTILFEIEDSAGNRQELVIRAEQPVSLLFYEGADVSQEFYTIKLMRDAGLPIAEPLWLELDRTRLGARFIVSRKVMGRTYGGNLGSTEELPPELVKSLIATLIKMHRVKVDAADPLAQKSHLKEWLSCATITEVMRHYVRVYLPRLVETSGITMTPLLVRAFNWLDKNIPQVDEPPVVVHIDFALNNLLIEDNAIAAVLDWESSRLGDPADDIIWTQHNIGAYLSMPEFLDLYKAGTGWDVSAYRLAYARVAKCALNMITCQTAMHSLLKYDAAPINMAIIGYRYMAIFGADLNKLIAAAEQARE